MIYNYTSSKEIISKVFRDVRLQDAVWVDDAVEWIAEGLDFMNWKVRPVDKKVILFVESHACKLPPDIIANPIFMYSPDATEESDYSDFTHTLAYAGGDYALLKNIWMPNRNVTLESEAFFTINGNYINTSFETGFICVLYKGIPLDYEGYPLVPDSNKVKEALKWYIVTKLTEGGWQHPAGLNFLQCQEQWRRYCSIGRGEITMPSEQELDRLVEQWTSLIPFSNKIKELGGMGNIERTSDYIQFVIQ